jgi:hypothetical protein
MRRAARAEIRTFELGNHIGGHGLDARASGSLPALCNLRLRQLLDLVTRCSARDIDKT